MINKAEIQKLFEVTENMKHKVVLALLYYAGLRLSEVRNLRWQDIDFEREIIHIRRAKGEKERVIFLHKELKRLLKEYGIRKSGFVLISERGERYNERTIQQLVGHKSLRTAQIYTHVANRDIKKLAKLL